MDGEIRKPGQDPAMLLRISEHFLRRRYYDDCRKYAQQAHQINPNFPGVTGILAVADVLLASKHQTTNGTLTDWYEVMQLNRYSHDADLIRQKFNYLYGILNPSNNKFAFADEAFDCVREAWYVLSNPLKRVEFDDLLKNVVNDEQSNVNLAFWTVCPYCYYLYEYPRVYLECCLWCSNEKCAKAFTCVEIDRPPEEVLREGKYMCTGFLQLGFQRGGWNPFKPLKKQKVNNDASEFVEISDDDGVDEVKTNVGSEIPTSKPNMGRKKSLAKTTKKVTGAGNRVTKQGIVHPEVTNMIVWSADDGCENEFSCGDVVGSMNVGDVEFYDADGDILVSLQNNI